MVTKSHVLHNLKMTYMEFLALGAWIRDPVHLWDGISVWIISKSGGSHQSLLCLAGVPYNHFTYDVKWINEWLCLEIIEVLQLVHLTRTIESAPSNPSWLLRVESNAHKTRRQVDHSIGFLRVQVPSIQIPSAESGFVGAPVFVVKSAVRGCHNSPSAVPGQPSHY